MNKSYFRRGNAEYEKYIHSSEWKEKAAQRMELDGHRCCVCGEEASEVHHLTYDNFRNEKMEDLVSLCHRCHEKAEEIYSPEVVSWAIEEVKEQENCFMAAMREDAARIAPVVLDHIMKVRGSGFAELLGLRQPKGCDKKRYWSELRKAVNALCRKRYSFNCAEDRSDLMLESISNHVAVICLAQIEHDLRNAIQAELHEIVETEYSVFGKWKDVAEYLGISTGVLSRMRKDDGSSMGPWLRAAVFYYCSLDAAAGIAPPEGFECLTENDYSFLKKIASYARKVTKEELI